MLQKCSIFFAGRCGAGLYRRAKPANGIPKPAFWKKSGGFDRRWESSGLFFVL